MKTSIIRAAILTPFSGNRWGLPLCVEDEPGTGKTALMIQVAQELGIPYEVLSPGERGEAAFGVVPVPVNGTLTYPRPDWTSKFEGDDRGKGESDADARLLPGRAGLVFVDELTTAPPMIQAALLGLVLERRIGSHTLPSRVRIVGAYNPPELAAGGFDLSAPLANRCGHLRWGAPTVDEHAAYMLRGDTGNGGHREVDNPIRGEEKRVLGLWPEAFAIARGLEVAFLTRRPNLKNACPKAGDPKVGRAWASDRTWEMAARALASADVHNLSETDTEMFVAAYVGEGVASEFFAFKTNQDLPNPADLLDGKETFNHSSKRVDRTAAVLNACTALVTPNAAEKRVPRAKAMWGMIERLTSNKIDLDIFTPAIFALIDAGLHNMQEATKAMSNVQPIIRNAKITPASRK